MRVGERARAPRAAATSGSAMPTRNTGRSALAQELGGRARCARGSPAGRGGAASGRGRGRSRVVGHVHQEIERHLEEHRARARSPARRGTRRRCTRRCGASSGTCTLHLVIGRISVDVVHVLERAHVGRARLGPAPPMTIIGMPARCALATAVTTSVTPGPAVTAHTPGPPGDARVAVGGVAGGLLVAHVDDADALRRGSRRRWPGCARRRA